jgi:hypothetical protein
MNIVDLLVTIVVVTILVTIILAIVTYIAYKLRLSREPALREPSGDGLTYFVRYDPVQPLLDQDLDASALARLDQDVKSLEGHATEA